MAYERGEKIIVWKRFTDPTYHLKKGVIVGRKLQRVCIKFPERIDGRHHIWMNVASVANKEDFLCLQLEGRVEPLIRNSN